MTAVLRSFCASVCRETIEKGNLLKLLLTKLTNKMKKVFTKARYLLALVCLVLLGTNVAWAQSTTLFDYTVSEGDGKTNGATATVGTVTLGADKVEVPDGFDVFGYKSDGDAGATSTKYLKGTLTSTAKFAVGDVITVKMYCTSTPSGSDYGISIYADRGDEQPVGTLYCTKKTTVETFSYTVKEGDAIVGKPEFYLFRAKGKSTYIVSAKVTRSTEVTPGEDDQRNYSAIAKWDFTNWSAVTVNNLKADAAASKETGWSDVESLTKDDTTEASKDNCFWAITTPSEFGELSANGTLIEELKGLVFGVNVNNRGLAIAVNYPKALSEYHGGAYLWLGGAEKKFFTIPAVKGGSTIKMGVESHKTTDARGVQLYIGGTALGAAFKPTIYEENTWTVPEGQAVDIIVDNTNGCHIYYIEIEQDLVAKLKFYLAKANALTGTYTEESIKNLNTAVAAAKTVLEDQEASEQAVKEALENLLAAKDALVEDPLADLKVEVATAIADAESSILFTAAIYTDATMAALKDAIAKAKEALSAEEITKESLTAAKESLTAAKKSLIKKEFVTTVTYAIQEGESHNAGDTVEVEGVATLTFGVAGGAEFAANKTKKDDKRLEGFWGYTEGNGQNGKSNEGTVYIINPKYDGLVEVGIVLSENKNFYVEENGVALDDFNGITVPEKLYGMAAFNVKSGSEYRIYGAGTKLGFYGFNYKFSLPREITITEAGWATLYTGYALDFSETGLTVYTATCEDNTVTLEPVGDDGIVPANTGVVLKGEANTYEIPVTETSKTINSDLKGSAAEDVTCDNDNMDYYILAYKKDENKVQFTRFAGETIAAGKAYLEFKKSATGESRILNVVIADETTGINEAVVNGQQATGTYNLNGQRVAQPTKGLYIVNGKKVIIK